MFKTCEECNKCNVPCENCIKEDICPFKDKFKNVYERLECQEMLKRSIILSAHYDRSLDEHVDLEFKCKRFKPV
jgi:hypothetical protein